MELSNVDWTLGQYAGKTGATCHRERLRWSLDASHGLLIRMLNCTQAVHVFEDEGVKIGLPGWLLKIGSRCEHGLT